MDTYTHTYICLYPMSHDVRSVLLLCQDKKILKATGVYVKRTVTSKTTYTGSSGIFFCEDSEKSILNNINIANCLVSTNLPRTRELLSIHSCKLLNPTHISQQLCKSITTLCLSCCHVSFPLLRLALQDRKSVV